MCDHMTFCVEVYIASPRVVLNPFWKILQVRQSEAPNKKDSCGSKPAIFFWLLGKVDTQWW